MHSLSGQLPVLARADSWAGVDRAVPFRLRVAEQSRAEREGRAGARAPKQEGAPDADGADDGEARDADEEEEEEDEDEGTRFCLFSFRVLNSGPAGVKDAFLGDQ